MFPKTILTAKNKLFSTKYWIWLNTNLSNVLEIDANNDIGRLFSISFFSPCLNSGVTLAIFHFSGKILVYSDWFIMIVSVDAIIWVISLSNATFGFYIIYIFHYVIACTKYELKCVNGRSSQVRIEQIPAGTRHNNNVFTTSTQLRRHRVDVVNTLSLRHYCVMCPSGWLLEVSIWFASGDPTEGKYLLNLLVVDDIFVIWQPLSKNILGFRICISSFFICLLGCPKFFVYFSGIFSILLFNS